MGYRDSVKSFMSFAREGNRPKIEQFEWMRSKKMELVKSIDQLGQIIDASIKSKLYALDLETTGLNTTVYDDRTVDQIVGFCLSYDGESGYYIPVRHTGAGEVANLPLLEVEAQFRRLANSDAIGIFHNSKFDTAFLRYNGGEPMGVWDEHKKFEDTLILAHLRDSRTRRKGLKGLSLTELNCEMIELKQLFPPGTKNFDFSTLDPNWAPVVWYAASDAICTYNLFKILYPQVVGPQAVPNQQVIYSIEKMCIPATLWMETNRVPISQEKVRELIQIGQKEYFEAIKAVYAFCEETLGRDVSPPWWKVLSEGVSYDDGDGDPKEPIPPVFNADDTVMDFTKQCEEAEKIVKHNSKRPTWDQSLSLSKKVEESQLKEARVLSTGEEREFPYQYDVLSPQQLGPLMEEMEVPDLRYTEKSHQVMTTAAEMDRLTELHGETFPFMAKIKRFRALHKALSTFLYPLRLRKDGGDASDRDSMIKINYNGLKVDTGRFATPGTKRGHLDGGTRYNIHSTPAGYDPQRPECLRRLRECIRARDGYFILANDYSGVELRIVTNLSREPKWITEYFRCSQCDFKFSRGDGESTPEAPPPFCPNCGSDKIGDLHSLSAIAFYGQDSTASPKEFKLLRQKSKCVDPSTLIWTGQGLRTMKSLSYGSCDTFQAAQGISVWNGSEQVPVLETYNGGLKDMYHVITRRGLVTCSAEHKFLTAAGGLASVSEGLVEGLELRDPNRDASLGDSDWVSVRYRPHRRIPEMFCPTNEKMAYFAGLFLGDGAKHGKNSVGVVHGHVDKTDQLGVPYLEWQGILKESLEEVGFTPVSRKKSLSLGSRHVMRFLGALELIKGGVEGTRNLRIPSWVLSQGRTALLHFLGGLFDTDGCVSERDASLSVTTKDAQFAGQIAAALYSLGVLPSLDPSWNHTYERYYYRVRVRGSEAPLFKPYMRHPGKITRFRDEVRTRKPVQNKVLKIIPAGEGQCVDLHISSKDHIYWTNGVPTHNSVNFALCYGGSGKAVTRTINCDDNEGWRIARQFNDTYRGLKDWWAKQHAFARKHGFVLTALGRKYPVPDIQLKRKTKNPVTGQWQDNGGFIAKAERNSVNSPIQGTSADITKLAMALTYKEFKAAGLLDKCKMIITMHDELVFEVHQDYVEQSLDILKVAMARNKAILSLKWPVPLTLDYEIAKDWTAKYNLTEMFEGKEEWEPTLKPYFPKAVARLEALQKGEAEVAAENEATEAAAGPSEMPKVAVDPNLPDLKPGEVYEYRLRHPRRQGTVEKLVQVLAKCEGKGTHPLRIKFRERDDGDAGIDVKGYFTNPIIFKMVAEESGL